MTDEPHPLGTFIADAFLHMIEEARAEVLEHEREVADAKQRLDNLIRIHAALTETATTGTLQ